jgi:hypothetical protein
MTTPPHLRHRADRFVRTLYFRVLRPAARPVVSDMVIRMSYGVLTLSVMGFVAGALLVPIAVFGGIGHVAAGRGFYALWFALACLGLAVLSTGIGFLLGFVGLPFSADFITEWPAYAIALCLSLAGCALLAVLIFLTPVPAWGAIPLVLVLVSGLAYVIALGLPRPRRRLRARARAVSRR